MYRASRRANIACKEAIEAAISEHYRDNRLDRDAVPQVIEQFGYTRTLYVLANTVQQMEWDGRFSPANKAWAKTVDIPPNPDGFGGDRNLDFVVDVYKRQGLEWIKSIGRTVQRDNYDLVYTAPLTPGDLKGSVLDNLEYRFNNEHPADYRHPSMSVSDIVAIKQDGKVSCHYCDSFGFQQIPGFLLDNPLKSAEMTVEDDYGMIDGVINNGPKEPTVAQLEQQARSGQPISLMDLAAAAHREDRDKKKSVMDQLKSQPKPEHKKTAPKKSAEREI